MCVFTYGMSCFFITMWKKNAWRNQNERHWRRDPACYSVFISKFDLIRKQKNDNLNPTYSSYLLRQRMLKSFYLTFRLNACKWRSTIWSGVEWGGEKRFMTLSLKLHLHHRHIFIFSKHFETWTLIMPHNLLITSLMYLWCVMNVVYAGMCQ